MDIVGFGPHPDDVELTSGGLFLKMADAGYKTAVVDLTAGEAGTRGTPAIRAQEAAASAKLMGLQTRLNLGMADGELLPSKEAKRAVAKVIRQLRPNIIVIPFWEDSHPDHKHASQIVEEGAFIAGLRSLDIDGEAWRPKVILYAMYHQAANFVPSFVVDVTEFMERKKDLAACYKSQFHQADSDEPETNISQLDFFARLEARARLAGDLIGVEFGEAYMMKSPLRIDDPVAHFQSWDKLI